MRFGDGFRMVSKNCPRQFRENAEPTFQRRHYCRLFKDAEQKRCWPKLIATLGRSHARTPGRPDARTLARPDARTSGRPGVRTPGRSDACPPLFSIFAFVAARARAGPRGRAGRAAPPWRRPSPRRTQKLRKTNEKRTKNEILVSYLFRPAVNWI